MSTYSQVLNELRQNNWKTLNSIKTRNLDIAKFESQRLQEQGRLLNLAGQFGADLMEKWGTKIEQDRENDIRVNFMLNEMEDWAGSDEADEASATLLDVKAKQDGISNFLTQVRSDGAPSHAIHEAENRSGKWNRVYHQLNAQSLGNGYDAYVTNQLLTNTDMFVANIDGKPVDITVNSLDKSFKEAIATRNYLRKEYFNKHNINGYTKEFLALSPERGGSGFYAQILKADKAAYLALEKQYDIKESLDKQAFTQLNWKQTKTSDAFVQMYNTLANGVNEKGKAIGHEGAHKFIREEILEPGINAGQVSLDDLVTIANTEVNGYIMGEQWSQIYGIEEGKEGTLVRKFFEAQDNIANDENKQGLIQATEQGNNLIKAIDNNQIRSDKNYSDAIKQIRDLDKGNLYKYDKIFRAWESRKESPEKTQDAVDTLIEKSKSGTLITDLVNSESDAVKNDPFIKDILATEQQLLGRKDVKQYLKDIKTNFQTEAGALGLRPDEFKNASAAKAYELKRDYFVQQIKDGNPASLALANTEKWFKENGGDNEEVRENFVDDTGKFIDNDFGLFAKDMSGHYPNIEAQIVGTKEGLASPYIVQNKDKEESAIIIDTVVKNKFDGDYTKALQAIDPNTKNAAYQIPAENKLFKGDVDYNNLLEQTGMATTWMMEEARRAGMSLGKWMNLRQIAHGKAPLKDEFLEYLGEPDVMNLKSGMQNRLNGHTVDGLFRPEEISATLAKENNKLNIVQETTYGNENLGNASQEIFDLPVNDKGEITVGGREAEGVKTVSCIATACGASLSNSFAQDLQEGKEYEFTELIANIPPENIIQMWNDPEFGKNMYALTGNLYNLPLEDSLVGSELDLQNKQLIFEDLEKYWYKSSIDSDFGHEVRTFVDDENIQKNTDVTSAGTENIDESINTED